MGWTDARARRNDVHAKWPARSTQHAPSLGADSDSDTGPARAAPRRPPSMELPAQRQLRLQRMQRLQRSDLVYVSPARDGEDARPSSSLSRSAANMGLAQRRSAVPAAWIHPAPANTVEATGREKRAANASRSGKGGNAAATSWHGASNSSWHQSANHLQKEGDTTSSWPKDLAWNGGKASSSDLGAARFEAALQRIGRGVS